MQENREKIIVKTSIIGIAVNVLLAAFKAAVGLVSNSIAIVLDAVNNLSDALSSGITIAGTKLANRRPDKKHPLGYGRFEYLNAMIVSGIVLYAGIKSAVESIKKLIWPESATYDVLTLVILAVAVATKILLGRYVQSQGKKVHSDSLIASGKDASNDAVISLSVLLSAIIYIFSGISLEAIVGIVISVMIIKSGIEMVRETLNKILGERMDREVVDEVKVTIREYPGIYDAYDLILHSYGPDRLFGSVHVEVPDTMTASQIDKMERELAELVFKKHGIIMTGIGIYSKNTQDNNAAALESQIRRIIMSHDGILQMHGFYVDEQEKKISMDIILDFDIKDRRALYLQIQNEVVQAVPDYRLQMTMDIDI